MGGAGLIPAVHSAASFTVAPGRRGYPAPGSAGSPAWHAASLPTHSAHLLQQAPAGYYMPGPQPVPGAWAGQPMAMAQQWGAQAVGPAMRYGPPLPQQPGAAPDPAASRQAAAQYQAQELSAEQQQALYYQQLQAQQQQAYMWQAQQSQFLMYQQAAAQAQMAAQAQAAAQALHADEPLFAREPMPQVPVALDPSGRPFKASCSTCAIRLRVYSGSPSLALSLRPPCLTAGHASVHSYHDATAWDHGCRLSSLPKVCPRPLMQVFHGVAARSIRKPERYQTDGRPAWSR